MTDQKNALGKAAGWTTWHEVYVGTLAAFVTYVGVPRPRASPSRPASSRDLWVRRVAQSGVLENPGRIL